MDVYGVIYKITNKINGKIYIGMTTRSINKRFSEHKAKSKKFNKPLYTDMRKFGTYNFEIEPSNGIGYNNTLPWHIKEDFKLFKQKTLGHTLLMGGNTFRSIGKALPGRITIVLTKEDIRIKNVIIIKSLDELWEDDCLLYEDELFICGGLQIYNMFIKIADKLYLSCINKDYVCDTFFPDYSNYKLINQTEYNVNTENSFTFKEYINDKNI